ncbi:hypothetical protein [Paraburkholderia sp. BR10882]|uniref:hypothetical protein n=1 Tax=unclassified Paraburkholderia TaxID=2615204 RepID=UPI0034CF042E
MAQQDRAVRPEHAERVVRFLSDGFSDYIAARVLLLQGLLQQGAILASTALEKYLKATMASHGDESHGHLKKAHWATVRNKYPELFSLMNESFLKLCQKCYDLRYTLDVPRGYNVVIASREFLAELDHTVLLMETRFVRANASGIPEKTRFELMTEGQDERLLRDNHVLLKQDKNAFVYGAAQTVHELRRISNGRIVELTYRTGSIPNDPSFTREAFVPKAGDDRSYELSHLPFQ